MVDIDSVGAGGGSVGWVDPLGILRVGPQSAGADPGPTCYDRGGTEAAVTDALLVLGYINPRGFLGGEMRLDEQAALAACTRLGERLGSSAAQAAWGIREIAKTGMVRALRARFAERGLDPRVFTMDSMGGCGALLSAATAQERHMQRVLVPELASVLSAFGAATAALDPALLDLVEVRTTPREHAVRAPSLVAIGLAHHMASSKIRLLGSRLNSLVWKSRTGRSWLAAWCSIVGSAANRLPVASIIRNAKLCVMHIHAASRPGTR